MTILSEKYSYVQGVDATTRVQKFFYASLCNRTLLKCDFVNSDLHCLSFRCVCHMTASDLFPFLSTLRLV